MTTPVWTRFARLGIADRALLPHDALLKPYRVDAIHRVKGEAPDVQAHDTLIRVESRSTLPPGPGSLAGVAQHVLYATAAERTDLLALSAAESGPLAVLIPITKSSDWWALAQDQRDAIFRGRRGTTAPTPGHLTVGLGYAARIYRKLYHARCLPGSCWDFLTYFEFPAERSEEFRALLEALRDESINPEWAFVERESEIWMSAL